MRKIPFAPAAIAAVFAMTAFLTSAEVEWDWGSAPSEVRDHSWRINAGSILSIDGTVDETFRSYYKATGQNDKQSLAESYSLDDFDVKGPYGMLGFQYDRQWNFFAFKWEMMFFKMSSDAVASRNYYVGVGDDVSYGGRDYDHMVIPEGSDFSIDIFGAMTDFMFSFTPFTFHYGDYVSLTPSIDAGLMLLGGRYEIDAGAPRGTTVYQNPPVDFVIGGDSASIVGAGAPEIGLGATLRVGSEDMVQWVTHASIGYFSYSGSTKPFTSASHREKDLDVKYLSLMVETGWRFPLRSGCAISLGGQLRMITLDGSIKSKYTDDEDVIRARERFDKDIDLDMVTALVFLGFEY